MRDVRKSGAGRKKMRVVLRIKVAKAPAAENKDRTTNARRFVMTNE